MPRYTFDALTASLLVTDTPVACDAPRGPGVPFTLSYRHREPLQPQIFTYANLGPKWTFAWLRFVQEQPALGQEPSHVWVQLPRGGRDVYVNPDPFGVYPAHRRTRARLVKVSESPVRYEVRFPDGRVEVYAQGDGGPSGQRRVFLTQLIDPRDQALTFTWDAQLRLIAITDAIDQVTTLEYDDPGDALKITAVEDPFGRRATFTYNPAGQLASITDTLGLTSSFGYGPNDFISTLTTPYGTTSFRHEANALTTNSLRSIEATDPLGATEHLEFQWETPTLAATDPANEVPTGFAAWNANLDHYNAVYWDRRAWREGPGDVTKAVVTHWLLGPEWPGATPYSVNIPHSVKRPLEARVWYAYPGQGTGTEDEAGWWQPPSRVGRVLDDETSPITETTYNDEGSVLTRTDPLGRQTTYTYGANGVDLLTVRQTSGELSELLASFSDFTALHQPQTLTDAAGETTALTYNAAGQVLTITNPKDETTTYGYDADGRLTSVTGPVTGATTTMTYDGYGRVRTVTGPDAYTVTMDYDVADRLIRLTYPDGTYDQTVYDRLDVAQSRDRLGRWTYRAHDARRRLVSTRDPAGRVVRQEWGADGKLDALIDANGHATRWERDLQGRVTEERRADSRTTVYAYEETTSRLESVTDAKQQVTTYGYDLADAVTSIAFTNAEHTTPNVSFTYDAAYRRLATMVDGTGTTTYAYHPITDPPTLGAGRLASVDGPLASDAITYTYDELGRVVTTAINGAANTVTWAYDALGRTTSEQNVLGTFAYTYDGTTGRVASVTYPNDQTSTYSYFDNQGDRRLQTIHHRYPNTNTLSKFDYTYDAIGNIVTWRQQADTGAVVWDYGYDAADQLLAAVKTSTDATPQVLQRFAYAYDPAGNRTLEQIDDAVTLSTHNDVNELVTQAPGGALAFEGTLDEPGTVTVDGAPAAVTTANTFRGMASVAAGTNTVTIAARDASGNVRTNEYEVDIAGAGKMFTYDDNGNLTSDGTRSFEWDARNQLIAINVGTHRSEFSYDGLRRRAKLLEKEEGETQSEIRVVWCGARVCEHRAADGQAITRRLFTRGEQVSGSPRFLATDHLGTVREVTDGTAALMARYDFDPWGRRSLVAGTDVATVGFTRHEWQGRGDLWVTRYRAYDPQLARWLSEDPIGLRGGLNYYGYVKNNPVRFVDPDGRMVIIIVLGVKAAELALYYAAATLAALAIGETLSEWIFSEDETADSRGPLDDYPANADEWEVPEGWTENPKTGEGSGGKHRQWDGPDGAWRRWDRGGREAGKERGPHWHDWRRPNDHICPTR